ncbi:MAG: hypothetical protein R3E68_03510 [Burkholderiaceae bacterium]
MLQLGEAGLVDGDPDGDEAAGFPHLDRRPGKCRAPRRVELERIARDRIAIQLPGYAVLSSWPGWNPLQIPSRPRSG